LVLHEIGHTVDYERLYKSYGYLPPHRKAYFLPRELNEYAEYEMMTIWSDYFSERFAYSLICEATPPLKDDIFELLHDTDSNGVVEDAGKTFRLLYWFALYIAYYHNKNEDILLSVDDKYNRTLSLLLTIADTLSELYVNKDLWDFEAVIANLGSLFIELYNSQYVNSEFD